MPPIRQNIIGDLRSTLEEIQVANGFTYDVQTVYQGQATPEKFKAFPIIEFDDLHEAYDRKGNASLDRELTLGVMGILKANIQMSSEAVLEAAYDLLADIEKAVLTDRCRDGNAIDTLLVSNDIQKSEATDPYVVVLVEVLVKYRTNLTDPTSLT